MSQALVVDPKQRTSVTFTVTGDPWQLVEAWAQRQRFRLHDPASDSQVRVYQKGLGFLAAPTRARFAVEGDRVQLQAWVHVPLLARITSLFLLPREMGIQSGGFRGAVPRTMARSAINDLLSNVGAPPVK